MNEGNAQRPVFPDRGKINEGSARIPFLPGHV